MVYRIESLVATPLNVPLIDPFTIASGRIDATRAALVEATVIDDRTNARATGLGEAAALPPVTREDQPDILGAVRSLSARVTGEGFEGDDPSAWSSLLGEGSPELRGRPVARAGVEIALLDAVARLRGVSLFRLLRRWEGGEFETRIESDITIPIHDPAYMAALAEGWWGRGFRCFKVKVGLDVERDLAALTAIHERVPGATFRVDANGGYDARTAISLIARATARGVAIECFEQPCARADLEGMALVTRELSLPVIADESVCTLDELDRVVERRAASGVNLKVVKSGGAVVATEIGRRARAYGLAVMCGGMVETRLGMTTAAHVCVAVGGVRFVDLDTAWLLSADPFVGGYRAEGARYEVPDEPGQAIEHRPRRV